jgi:hypothetical protein
MLVLPGIFAELFLKLLVSGNKFVTYVEVIKHVAVQKQCIIQIYIIFTFLKLQSVSFTISKIILLTNFLYKLNL